ncbi:hypothetical protein ACHWQZ_G002939 [Mnemiopsis leidyi]
MEELIAELAKSGFQNRILRHHQEEGLKWLCSCYEIQNGGILADEMGLGKTTQSLAFLCVKAKLNCPSLVVAPLSVLNNWSAELTSFLPNFTVIKYYGDAETRNLLREKSGHFYITTYETILKDSDFFARKMWNILIVDEGHRVKNSEGQTNLKLRELKCAFRLILSGTPVQNNLGELYSLLSFVDAEAFPLDDMTDFCSRYEQQKFNNELHELLRPYLLRRTKTQVLNKLPPSQESIIFCQLSSLQKRVYKGVLTKDASVIDLATNKSVLQNTIMQLRKCSNHPYMFNGVEPEPFRIGEHIVDASGKLKTLDRILRYCKSNNHRVLIFSQFTLTLDILQDYAQYRAFSYERLDGSVRDQERFNSINNFSQNDIFCFLLSTKAGGVGLNLTAADTVIFFDTDWNPQNDLQAAARAHRIGQTKPVKIIRLVSQNTVDEYMLKKMESKLKLTKRVINEGGFSTLDVAPEDSKTLSDMLLFGLNNLLENEDMVDNDVESLLGETNSNSEWVFVDQPSSSNANEKIGMEIDDFYDFEGTNYREKNAKDKEAFDRMVMENKVIVPVESSTSSSVRSRKTVFMSEQEVKEKENILQKEHLAALELRKAKREAKRKEKWEELGYVSKALPASVLPGNLSSTLDLEYVVGDVTLPDKEGVIIHCTDTSGEWGKGGLFTALTKLSQNPRNCYELAKDMDDLRLGQCHVVDYFPDLSVALLSCIRRGSASIKLDLKSLGEALTSLGHYAKQKNVSVHMPRVGFSVEDWYGTERLLRKCLLSQDVPTLVYYFSKRSSLKSSRQNTSSPKPGPSHLSDDPKLQSPTVKKLKTSLSDCYFNKTVYLDPDLSSSERAVLERYVIAANGNVQNFLSGDVTHIISYDTQFRTNDNYQADIISPSQFAKTLSDRSLQ